MIIVGGLFYSGGGTRVVDGKNYCWMECDFTIILMEELMSRLVCLVVTEAHPAFFGSAELTPTTQPK